MKTSLHHSLALLLLLPLSSLADPVVTDVVAKQRYPWNGLVDISFKLSGAESGRIAVTATDTATGAEVPVHTLRDRSGNAVRKYREIVSGEVSLVWDAGTDFPNAVIEALMISVVALPVRKVQLWENGPYWAETNVGAEKPEDAGLYFWWGDTMGYRREGSAWVASDGSSQNFSFNMGNTPTYGKDNASLRSEGWIAADGVLAPEHDAAHVHRGGAWRMPTKDELSALDSNCDWSWTTRNGVNGYLVRGRGDYASASIFLPAAGCGYGTSLDDAGFYGLYWSSVPHSSYSGYAWDLYFGSSNHYMNVIDRMYDIDRLYGQSVRPVQGFAE